jgi:hypothetical protein
MGKKRKQGPFPLCIPLYIKIYNTKNLYVEAMFFISAMHIIGNTKEFESDALGRRVTLCCVCIILTVNGAGSSNKWRHDSVGHYSVPSHGKS